MEELGQADRTTGHGHHSLLEAQVNGWTAVPRSQDKFLAHAQAESVKQISLENIKLPVTDIVKKVREYVQSQLPEATYNHSMRVFCWGMILLKNFAPDLTSFKVTPGLIETFYLSSLLHDIGAVSTNIKATRISFELWGALKARELLSEFGAHPDQADLVAETINRHQDLGESGQVPAVLALIYFGTLFDNVGANGKLIHKSDIEAVCREYPRIQWSHCFSATIQEEIEEKPWSHTTVIDDFAEKVESNKLMQPYD